MFQSFMAAAGGMSMGANASGGNILIQGAGCPYVNGVYERDGVYSGRPHYHHRASPTGTGTGAGEQLQIWWDNDDREWRIGRTLDYYYISKSYNLETAVWQLPRVHRNRNARHPAPVTRGAGAFNPAMGGMAPSGMVQPSMMQPNAHMNAFNQHQMLWQQQQMQHQRLQQQHQMLMQQHNMHQLGGSQWQQHQHQWQQHQHQWQQQQQNHMMQVQSHNQWLTTHPGHGAPLPMAMPMAQSGAMQPGMPMATVPQQRPGSIGQSLFQSAMGMF
jgi:hypothetical protein